MASKRVSRIPMSHRKAITKSLEELSDLIKEARERKNLTQEQLAEKLDLGTTTLQSIERGRRFPSLPTLLYICRVLKISIRFEMKDD